MHLCGSISWNGACVYTRAMCELVSELCFYPKLIETTIKFDRNSSLKPTDDNLINFGNMH